MLDPLSTTLSVLGTIFVVAGGLEAGSRRITLKTQGQNDITETNCDALCHQMKQRWNERCLAIADETYQRDRYQQAALAAAGATAAALALTIAAGYAAASIFGGLLALALAAAALIATALADAALGFAASAFQGSINANTRANEARAAFGSAQYQMAETCGSQRYDACQNSLPPCP